MQRGATNAIEKKFGAMVDKPRDQVRVTSSGGKVKRCHSVEVSIIQARF